MAHSAVHMILKRKVNGSNPGGVAPPIGRQRNAIRQPICSHQTFEGLQQETDQIRSFDSRETGPQDCPDL